MDESGFCSLLPELLLPFYCGCNSKLEKLCSSVDAVVQLWCFFPPSSVISKRCQSLLLQIYLHFPEVIQHVTLPEGTFSSGGAAYSNSCKVGALHSKPFFFF